MDTRGNLRTPIILWIVFSIALAALYLFLDPILVAHQVVPASASDVLDSSYKIMQILTLLSIPVLVGVVVFATYSIVRFRTNGRPTGAGANIRGNNRLLAWWLVVSFVLCTVLYVIGFDGLAEIEAAAPLSAVHVHVTAQQWIFNYTYSDYGISSSTLYLPVNQPVEFSITSEDVQHSFWIPEMGVKEDAVPGYTTTFVATPNKVGHYTVRCMELCGMFHSYMNTNVVVMSKDDFGKWISSQSSVRPASMFAWIQLPEAALLGESGKHS